MPTPNRAQKAALLTAALLALLAGAAWWLAGESGGGGEPQARLSLADRLGGDAEGYAVADAPRDFAFPADHGPHPDFRTEWWYFTGNLRAVGGDGAGRRFGYQLTFFRSAVAPPGAAAGDGGSAWRTRQVWMAHLALTDVAGRRFHAAERFARGALGLAGATAEPFTVRVLDWKVTGEDVGFPWRLRAADGDRAIDLTLDAGKGSVLQGDAGLSQKGEGNGASYYYSFPRMPTTGTLVLGGERFAVAGDSWFDREWSSALLGAGRVGWDWFALQLDDGRELVAFRLRSDGDDATAGRQFDYAALVSAGGELRRLDGPGAELRSVGRWTSPATGVRYPSGWRLSLPDAGLDLEVQPWIDDQELDLAVRYWEGAVRVAGTAGGEAVGGTGYVELTGY